MSRFFRGLGGSLFYPRLSGVPCSIAVDHSKQGGDILYSIIRFIPFLALLFLIGCPSKIENPPKVVVSPQGVFVKGLHISLAHSGMYGWGVLVSCKTSTEGTIAYLIANANVLQSDPYYTLNIASADYRSNNVNRIEEVPVANVTYHSQYDLGIMPITNSNIFECFSEDYFVDSDKILNENGYADAIRRQLHLPDQVPSQGIVELLNQIMQ